MARFAIIESDGSPMTAYLSSPKKEPPFAGCILMHHRPGIDIFTIDCADRLAETGLRVVAPDLYHRQAPDVRTEDAKDRLDDDQIAADIGATLRFLQSDPGVDNTRIGILGHCQGGRTALLGLGSYSEFRAGCLYYGGGVFKRLGGNGPAPFNLVSRIKCPVAGFFGNDDRNPSPDDVSRLEAELDRHAVPHEFHRFDGAGHGFQDFTHVSRYRPEPTKAAWSLTLAFLKRELS